MQCDLCVSVCVCVCLEPAESISVLLKLSELANDHSSSSRSVLSNLLLAIKDKGNNMKNTDNNGLRRYLFIYLSILCRKEVTYG